MTSPEPARSARVSMPAHTLVYVQRVDGCRIMLSRCMLRRLDDEEFVDGCVPVETPEYDTPTGALCHPQWRGGCPAAADAGQQRLSEYD